jgi:predicted nucleotide-binding protein
MTVDEAKQRLTVSGLLIAQERRLGDDKGTQLRLSSGAIVNVFDTGSYSVQGTNQAQARSALDDGESPASYSPSAASSMSESHSSHAPAPNRVFIVYGHDPNSRDGLELILRRLRLEPIVLQNLVGAGDTIIEKLENLTHSDFACVLLTPDDEGCNIECRSDLKPRARQNVVLEMGMVLSRLGRKRVAILVKGGEIERPSDIDGLIYIPFQHQISEVKERLAAHLQTAGFDIHVADLLG